MTSLNIEQQNKIINALKNSSIVHWQHINFYGEYDFTEKPLDNEFDMEAFTKRGDIINKNIFRS